jgi:alpha-glucosidase (family GH31 glycosyl hydrolase)
LKIFTAGGKNLSQTTCSVFQEVTTGMAPHLIYRTIGGMLDIYFFPGPSPEDVVTQYLALIGTPMLPAYWALGFQLCSYGSFNNVADIQAAVNRTMKAGVPLDVVFADIKYMDHGEDFTIGSVEEIMLLKPYLIYLKPINLIP